MSSRRIDPPTWPLKLMRFFVKKEYLEEIEGDMEELFRDHLKEYSVAKAKRMYALDMLTLLRPVLLKNLAARFHTNHPAMFKNYFKISTRNVLKNPVNSFINIFGLSAAIGMCVFAYAFAQWTFATDQFHEHKHSVYLVTFMADRAGSMQQHGKTPRPIGEMLREDFPAIKKVCVVEDRNAIIKHNDNVFHERVRLTDPEFLEMLTFPMKWGTAGSLKDMNSIILSEEMSIKYFGEENSLGRTIQVIFGKGIHKDFKITGVAKKFPASRTISFNFLINLENLKTADPSYNWYDWKGLVNATLIQIDDPMKATWIEKGLEKYRGLQNKVVDEDWAISSFKLEPLATLHKSSEYMDDDISRSSRTNYISILFMVTIALFMLALACMNYINIAIATAAKRLKEIGIRKSIGATRKTVIIQFLSENLVITFAALIFGLILGLTFFIPGFELLWNFSMDFKLTSPSLLLFLSTILLITGILSGIYPAFYISRFQVVNILKGSVKFGQRNPLTKTFLAFQLIMSCIFITCSVLFSQNNTYLNNRPWGYNESQTLYASLPDEHAFEKLSAMMAQHPDVLSVSGSRHHIGKTHAKIVIHFPNRKYEVDQLSVDAKYFETMGVEIIQGRNFNDGDKSDRQAIVVNNAFVAAMNWTTPIGQQLRIDSTQYEIIGVVKDFHSYSFGEEIRPTLFSVADKADYRYLSLRVSDGSQQKTYQALQSNWTKLFPETPFDGGHQENVWGFYYEQLKIYDLVWKVVAVIAVVLATLGLYGLVRLNVEGRTKEFSIRKVLGAGATNIASSVIGQYVLLFTATILIGAPLGYLVGKKIIEFAYTYHKPTTLSAVFIALIIILVVLLGTISTQIRRVVKSNPVDGLKAE
jgi:putative ABC transport system permease protein